MVTHAARPFRRPSCYHLGLRLAASAFGLAIICARTTVGEDAASPPRSGFVRTYWYERGIEHGNPKPNERFRVNAPEVTLHASFGKRDEVKGNGLAQILIEEDLARVRAPELYLELWGGHPGTSAKRVGLNGRSVYPLPRNGTEEHECTHLYPTIPLRATDLVPSYNAIQFACDTGTTFWGHYIVDNAALRYRIPDDDERLVASGLASFLGTLSAAAGPAPETVRVALEVAPDASDRVASVDFFGRYDGYDGYDENGDTRSADWHGFTRAREPAAHLGRAREAPWRIDWDVSMLAEQSDLAVRAVVRFRDESSLTWESPAVPAPDIGARRERIVSRHPLRDRPKPFWSRANRLVRAAIDLDVDPARIERAELHVVLWDGGRGDVEHPFTLNGRPLDVAGAGRHDVLYRIVAIEPQHLRRGENTIELRSDTHHHGIEVLAPGPELFVRARGEEDARERKR